ncbi:hypothetical protein B0H13DRAFT_2338690 [Mycena leptocephala]|nr:hypothetical protein B0H13DRAFT_2338690 [Mycena leptocephala]
MSQNDLPPLPLIVYWMIAGNAEYLDNLHWPIPLYGFTTGVLGVLVQAFLVFRYWCLSCFITLLHPFLSIVRSITANSSTRKTLIALFLSFAIIISFGGLFASDTMTVLALYTLDTSLADRPMFKIPVALWLVTEFAVDTGITLVLLWEFRKARGILTETRSTLDRLTAVTIQSGTAVATLAGAGPISYYINPESNVPVAVLCPLRRVYVITLVRLFL